MCVFDFLQFHKGALSCSRHCSCAVTAVAAYPQLQASAITHAPSAVQISALHGGDTSTRTVKVYQELRQKTSHPDDDMAGWGAVQPWPCGMAHNKEQMIVLKVSFWKGN